MSGPMRALPIAVAVAFAAALFPLQRWMDARVPGDREAEELLYVSKGESVKALALGYESLLADLYWMRTIQFFGRKVIDDPKVLGDARGRLDLMYPLLDVATTLDPKDIAPYRFGGFFVHDYVDKALGKALLEKGVRNNPEDFRLYADLAYLYWNDGDCETASRLYAQGADVPGAPEWMRELSSRIPVRCGRADLTYEMLSRQYEASDDPRVREKLFAEIKEFRALAEVEYLRGAVEAFRQQFGKRPSSLAELMRALGPQPDAPVLRLTRGGTPLDPDGVPYAYDPATGEVTTGPGGTYLPLYGPTGGPAAGR